MVGLDGATAIETRRSGPRPAGSNCVKAGGFTGVQLSANHTPELAPVGSFTPIHSRAGVTPCAAVHTTSETTSDVPATVLNGAAGTSTHVADGAPVRIHSPLDVAAMKVVGVVVSTAMRKMPRPDRLVASTCHTCANGSAADGFTARSTPTPAL